VRNLDELGDATFRSNFGNPPRSNSIGRPDIKIPIGEYKSDVKAQKMRSADLVS